MPIKSNWDKKSAPVTKSEFRLPSAGLPYRAKYGDKVSDLVRISPYSILTESILTSNLSGWEKMKHITEAVMEYVTNSEVKFDLGDLLQADQHYALALARGLTYGEVYKFPSSCPHCGATENHEVSVPGTLPVCVWDAEKPPKLDVLLPNCKDTIRLRYLTVGNEDQLRDYRRQLIASGSNEMAADHSVFVRRTAYHIESVNGGTPDSIAEVDEYLIKAITGSDLVIFNEKIEEQQPGIRYSWTIICDSCSKKYDRNIPISSDFFRRNRV